MSWRLGEATRLIWVAERLLNAPNTMGYAPEATGTSVPSKQMHHVEMETQEGWRVNRRHQVTMKSSGAAQMLLRVGDMMGMSARWMA